MPMIVFRQAASGRGRAVSACMVVTLTAVEPLGRSARAGPSAPATEPRDWLVSASNVDDRSCLGTLRARA